MKAILLLAVLAAATPAIAQTTAPTYQGIDGQTREALGTFRQPVASAGAGATPSATPAAASSRVLKASAGNLYGLNIVSGGTAGYVLVFNAAAVPADGTVSPVKCYTLAANTALDLNFRDVPPHFTDGIAIAFSTGASCFAKAGTATAFISGDVR